MKLVFSSASSLVNKFHDLFLRVDTTPVRETKPLR